MDKSFSLKIKGEVINIEFNQACGYKLGQYLGVSDPTVSNLATAMKDMLEKDGMIGLKFMVSAGIYGYEFVNSDSPNSKFTPGEVGRLLIEMTDSEAKRLIESFYENLGLNLKAEIDNSDKKKEVKKKKKS